MTRRRISLIANLTAIILLLFVVISCIEKKPDLHASNQQKAKSESYFAKGMKLFHTGEMKSAKPELKTYLALPISGLNTDEAILTLGKIELYQSNYDEAEEYFVKLPRKFPASHFVAEARHLANVVRAERRKAEENNHVYQLEQEREQSDNEAEKQNTSAEIIDVQVNIGAYYAAFLEALDLYKVANSSLVQDDKNQAEAKLIEVVDKMSLSELFKAREDVELGSYGSGLLLFRLAAFNMHLRKFQAAQIFLAEFLRDNPDHQLYERASKILDKIKKRTIVSPNKIGILIPLDKRYKRIRQAIELAYKNVAIKNSQIEFIYRDTKADPLEAVKAFEKLVIEDNVIAVIGPLLGACSEAVAYKAEQFEVPLITLSPRSGLPDIGSYVFRNALTSNAQAEAIVRYAWEVQGKRTFAILYPLHPYGMDLAFAFWDQVKQRGGWITGVERYQHDETSFRKHIRNLVGRYYLLYGNERARKCKDPLGLKCGPVRLTQKDETKARVDFDALFIPDYARQAGMIAPTIPFEEVEIDTALKSTYRRIARKERRTGRKVKMVQLLGANGWNNPKLNEIGSNWVEGSVFSDGFYAYEKSPKIVKDFVADFDSSYGRSPSSLEAYTYDTVGLLTSIISKSKLANRMDMRQALSSMQNYKGVTGDMHFAKNGDIINPLMILTLSQGEIIIAPHKNSKEPKNNFTNEELQKESPEG